MSRLALPAFLMISSVSLAAEPPRIDGSWIDGQLESLTSLYKHLHQNPELSYEEVETSKRVAAELRQAGVEVTEEIGGHGLVGVIQNGPGKTVLVRSDLDALPVTEATGLPYASKATARDEEGNPVGVMHACGHDIHMTCLVGVARWLKAHKDRWSGTVVLIGQPAEERVGGARKMLEAGLYSKFPKPDVALALHVAHDLEAGKVGYCPGPAMASSTSVDVFVKGRGGHGASPHQTIDPIVLASLLVIDLQTIVSREIDPLDPAVVTVGSIHGGSKHNIIPAEVHLQLTLRAYKESVREQLIEGIQRRALALARAHKAPEPVVKVTEGTPATINTPELVEPVVATFRSVLGDENVVRVPQTMGAEDFGLFGTGGIPIFMFRLGTIPPARVADAKARQETLPSLHSALYAPDPEPSIRTGVSAMAAAVASLLPR